ncbi:MAG: hypothetical protein WC856_02895 [Methylococcaceae bacterium]|jgi:hypothetical protein
MIKINFSASAKRHFNDALLLEESNRLANAGQLYGFCAECGIKALLISLGYPTDAEGSPAPVKKPMLGKPNIRKHINQLLEIKSEIDTYASGRNGAKYLALIPSINSFSDWLVDHRYYAQHQIPSSLPAWKSSATEMMKMMDVASIDGVLK